MSQTNQNDSVVFDTKHLELDEKLHHITDEELYPPELEDLPCWDKCKHSLHTLYKKLVDYFEFDRVFDRQESPKFTLDKCYKRYKQNYDETYSERQLKFAYTFEYVLNERIKEQRRKKKQTCHELYRFICCESGNEIHDIDQSYLSDREYRKIVKKKLLERKEEFITMQKEMEQIEMYKEIHQENNRVESSLNNTQIAKQNQSISNVQTNVHTKIIKINRYETNHHINTAQHNYFDHNHDHIQDNLSIQQQPPINPHRDEKEHKMSNVFDQDEYIEDVTGNYAKINSNRKGSTPNIITNKYNHQNKRQSDNLVINIENKSSTVDLYEIEDGVELSDLPKRKKKNFKQTIDTMQTHQSNSHNPASNTLAMLESRDPHHQTLKNQTQQVIEQKMTTSMNHQTIQQSNQQSQIQYKQSISNTPHPLQSLTSPQRQNNNNSKNIQTNNYQHQQIVSHNPQPSFVFDEQSTPFQKNMQPPQDQYILDEEIDMPSSSVNKHKAGRKQRNVENNKIQYDLEDKSATKQPTTDHLDIQIEQQQNNPAFALKSRKNRMKKKANDPQSQAYEIALHYEQKDPFPNAHTLGERITTDSGLQIEQVAQKKRKLKKKLNHQEENLQQNILFQDEIYESTYNQKVTNQQHQSQQTFKKKNKKHLSIINNDMQDLEIFEDNTIADRKMSVSGFEGAKITMGESVTLKEGNEMVQAEKKRKRQKAKKREAQNEITEQIIDFDY